MYNILNVRTPVQTHQNSRQPPTLDTMLQFRDHIRRQNYILNDIVTDYNGNFASYIRLTENILSSNDANTIEMLNDMNARRTILYSFQNNMNTYNNNIVNLIDIVRSSQENLNQITSLYALQSFMNYFNDTAVEPTAGADTAAATPPLQPETVLPSIWRTGTDTEERFNRSIIWRRILSSGNTEFRRNREQPGNETREGLTMNGFIDAVENIPYDSSMNEMRCPISLEDFNVGETVCRIKECSHFFKISPLIRWLQNNVCCPVCRYDMRTPTRTIPNVPPSTSYNTNENTPQTEPQTETTTVFPPIAIDDTTNLMDLLESSIHDILGELEYENENTEETENNTSPQNENIYFAEFTFTPVGGTSNENDNRVGDSSQ